MTSNKEKQKKDLKSVYMTPLIIATIILLNLIIIVIIYNLIF